MSKKAFAAVLCIALSIIFFSLSVFCDDMIPANTLADATDTGVPSETLQTTSTAVTTADAEPYEASGYAKTLAIILSSAFVVFALVVAIKRPKD
ncbi:MAG: hypothetical protein IJF55_01445 [Clostridia bacterium]|nr:hypothetical protein [Clostridia bacterium]